MMTNKQKSIRRQLELLHQATAARLTRRDAIKMGIVTSGAGILNTGGALAQSGDVDDKVPSPSVKGYEFTEEMPVPPVMQPVQPSGLLAHPSYAANPHYPAFHQYWNKFPAKKYYYTSVRENKNHNFHGKLPNSTIWGFDGTFPGTTIDLKYGEPVVLRIKNDLPALNDPSITYGIPQTINHLHNFHTAPESDGCPWDWANPPAGNLPGEYNDCHYTMARAGFSEPPGSHKDSSGKDWGVYRNGEYGGDARETLSFVFTHQHRPEFTAANVYKGQAKIGRLFDEVDTGNEQDTAPGAYRLPSGPYDVPIVIADKHFDAETGLLIFDQFNTDGFLGDHLTVNGKIQPFFRVKARKYRFRILNIGPARFVRLVLRHNGQNLPFTKINDNGNMLESPIVLTQSEQWAAERNEYIVDFSKLSGKSVYLCNNMPMESGRKAIREKFLDPDLVDNQLLKFVVEEAVPDPSRIPLKFRPFPEVKLAEVVKKRHFRFERGNGMWQINGKLWDSEADHNPKLLANPEVQIQRNTAELWTLESSSGGWHHPIHIHFEEGHVLRTDGKVPKVRTRQDVYRVGRDHNKVEIFIRFRDFPEPNYYRNPPKQRRPYGDDPTKHRHPNEHNRWVMHCHNLSHEDHAMMQTFHIMPKSTDV
jgi:FtsP/CotA-like multicopper oxidase with cupredoxin domain